MAIKIKTWFYNNMVDWGVVKMNSIKKLIQDTIVEMFENGDLQIETHIDNSNYRKQLTTTIYHYPNEEGVTHRKEINSFSTEL